MDRLRILLPPSEGKASGGDGPPYDPATGAFQTLARSRERVRKALLMKAFDAERQLGVKGSALVNAVAVNRVLAGSATLPALRRYSGVLYDALGYAALPGAVRRNLDRDVLIVSGLLGVVAGGDLIPDYKLPIGAAVPRLGRLGTFWRPQLTQVLGVALENAVVWDLLPGAHAAAAPVRTAAVHWRVRVHREVGGRRITVSHENKTVKGALTRILVSGRIAHPDELRGWEGPGGYRLAGYAEPTAASPGLVDVVTSW